MTDMRQAIEPRSDQLNGDDLISGPRTIRITEVSINLNAEQKISVSYEGDNGKPWRPCKTTARQMVAAWGPDAKEYAGRSLTLFRDPSVKWGGMEVGGIRISHMSHIERDMVMALTVTKGKKAPLVVKPLKAEAVPLKVVKPEPTEDASPEFDLDGFAVMVDHFLRTTYDPDALTAWWDAQKPSRLQARAADKAKAGEIATKVAAKIAELTADLEGA